MASPRGANTYSAYGNTIPVDTSKENWQSIVNQKAAQNHRFDSVVLAAHGRPGYQHVTTYHVMDEIPGATSCIYNALKPGGRLLLGGCHVAAGQEGIYYSAALAAGAGYDKHISVTGCTGTFLPIPAISGDEITVDYKDRGHPAVMKGH